MNPDRGRLRVRPGMAWTACQSEAATSRGFDRASAAAEASEDRLGSLAGLSGVMPRDALGEHGAERVGVVDAARDEFTGEHLLDGDCQLLGRRRVRLKPGLLDRDANGAAGSEAVERALALEFAAQKVEGRFFSHDPVPTPRGTSLR